MAAPRKYPNEFRERAIRLTLKARMDPASRAGACARIGGQLGINPQTLRGWVAQAEVDAGARQGTSRSEAVGGPGAGEPGTTPVERDPADSIGFLRGRARPPRRHASRDAVGHHCGSWAISRIALSSRARHEVVNSTRPSWLGVGSGV